MPSPFRRFSRARFFLAGVLAAAVLPVLGVTLVSPWAFGWPVAGERQAVLRMAVHGSRSAIELVPVADLPRSLAFPSVQEGDVWVVASSGSRDTASGSRFPQARTGDTGAPTPTWTVGVIEESSLVTVGGTGGTTGSWPPFFDRLPDRSTPNWWPLPVPTPEAAAVIALMLAGLVALAFLAALVRGIRFALTIGARRRGRPT
jgi:hypothetical protein